jgi:hypothetical protein
MRLQPLTELFTKKPPKLPSKIAWQVEYALRTSYATAASFYFIYYFDWGPLTSISPVFAALATTMYVGVWQRSYWSVLFSSTVGGVVGTLVGFTYTHPLLQIFLIFWYILWLGKCILLTPIGKTFGGVIFVLGALYPTVTEGETTGIPLLITIILTANIPYLLTGLTLLFPFPRFSYSPSQQAIELLSDRYSRLLCDYVDGYCNSEESDLFLSLAQGHLNEAKQLLQSLIDLSVNLETECYLFPDLKPYSDNLKQLIPFFRRIHDGFTTMGTTLPDIIRNETHAMHIKVMKTTLRQTALEFRRVVMILTVSHMKELIPKTFCSLPIGRISCMKAMRRKIRAWQIYWQSVWDYLVQSWAPQLAFGAQEAPSPSAAERPIKGISEDFLLAIESLLAFEQVLLASAQCARDDYVFIRPPDAVAESSTGPSLGADSDTHTLSPLHRNQNMFTRQSSSIEEKDSQLSLQTFSQNLSPLQLYERSIYQSLPLITASPPRPRLNGSPQTKGFSFSTPESDAPKSTFIPTNKSPTSEAKSDISVSLSVKELELSPLPPSSPKVLTRASSASISFSEHPPTLFPSSHLVSDSPRSKSRSHSAGTGTSMGGNEDLESGPHEEMGVDETESIVSWRYTNLRHPSIYENTTLDQDTGIRTNYATILYFENLRYGTHNWSPRLSFLASLLTVMDLVGDLKHLNEEPPLQEPQLFQRNTDSFSFSLSSFRSSTSSWGSYLKSLVSVNAWRFQFRHPVITELLSNLLLIFKYLFDCLLEPYRVSQMVFHLFYIYCCCSCVGSSSPHSAAALSTTNAPSLPQEHQQRIADYRHYLHQYIHPVKIAIITVLCSLFVILPYFQKIFPYGLWGPVVVTLIRQDNSSSSFSRGFQRIEGTVLGCIYAYMISLFFHCETHSCYTPSVVVLVVGWLGLCAYFREGIQKGYAAIVAGFTPIIVLLGSSHGSQAGAWARVEMTVIGVTVYLIVDNLLIPSRADVAIRKNIISSITHTTKLLTATSHSLNGLFCLANPDLPSPPVPPLPSPPILASSTPAATGYSGDLLQSISPGGQILADYDEDDEEVSNYLSNHITRNMKHLDSANIELNLLAALISEQASLLQLAALEPELWHRYVESGGEVFFDCSSDHSPLPPINLCRDAWREFCSPLAHSIRGSSIFIAGLSKKLLCLSSIAMLT